MLKGISDGLFVSRANGAYRLQGSITQFGTKTLFASISSYSSRHSRGCSVSCELMNELFGAKQGCKERSTSWPENYNVWIRKHIGA